MKPFSILSSFLYEAIEDMGYTTRFPALGYVTYLIAAVMMHGCKAMRDEMTHRSFQVIRNSP
jgi:hypothetical protein